MSKRQINSFKSHTKDSLRKSYKTNDGKKGSDNDQDSESDITPNIPLRLYELYGMTEAVTDIIGEDTQTLDDSVCRQSVASFIEQYYSDNDIDLFWEDLDVSPESNMERIPDSQPQGFGSEAELDTQYITV